jgi:hypothetical protein
MVADKYLHKYFIWILAVILLFCPNFLYGQVCTYSVTLGTSNFSSNGGSSSVSVWPSSSNCSWSATTDAWWISMGSTGGTGVSTFSFSVSANTGIGARSGTMTIAWQTFTITQAGVGCSYSISPTSNSLTSSGGTGSVGVTSDCPWTASSNAGWITVTAGSGGSGNGTVSYSVSANTGTARSGTMTIGGQTFTVNQSGCSTSISPASNSFTSSSGSGSVSVTAPGGCSWTASSNAGWITVTAGSAGTGNGTVSYSVSAYTGTSTPRSGTITIAGQNFTVTQSGCNYTLSPTSITSTSGGITTLVSVYAPAGCSWTASSNVDWITITSSTAGIGNGGVIYSVSANTDIGTRSGTMTIAGQTFTVTQSGVSCKYSISPTSNSLTSGGGTGSVGVTAPSGCSWATSSNAGWITVTGGSSGSGNGTVSYSVSANTGTSTPRSGTMTIGGQTFTVTQSGCSYAISPTSNSLTYGGGGGSVGVTAPSGCSWTASSNSSWITITAGSSGTGNGTVSYSVSAYTGSSTRSGTMAIGGQAFTVTQSGCSYSISPTSNSFISSGGTGSVGVTATSGCNWTASSNVSWITITAGSSGSGSGYVSYSVSANTGTYGRSGMITIAGQTFTVNQSGCSPSISPTSNSFISSGGTGSVGVTATSGCPWTASSNSSWITITGGSSGTGNGTVSYSVSAYTGSSTPRSGTIAIGGQTFTVSQSGVSCSYAISPTSNSLTYGGGTGSVGVTAPSGCSWTASSNASWITVTGGSSGSGNGTVSYSVSAYTGTSTPRSGTMTIGGRTFTVTQSGVGCSYSLYPTSASFTSSGSTQSLNVNTTSGCSWTALSNDSWITITGGSSGSGNGTVSYSVSAYTGTSTHRSGTMTIAGQTFTVTQSGVSCSYSLAPASSSITSSSNTGSVGVTAPGGCSWTASSNASWITITTGSAGTGNGTVSYSVAANESSITRSGTMTIGGQTFTVTQAGGNISVRSSNAVISEVTVTNSISGAPSNYTPTTLVSFKASGVISTANITINYSSLPANPVLYKVVNGEWKQIYPTNQSNGITYIALSGNTLSFTIADNSACDADPAVGVISDPIVAGSETTNAPLYFPHVATSLPWQTEIAIINTSSSQTVTGTLKAFRDNGQLVETKDVTLSARGRRQIIVANEFINHTNIRYIIFDTNSATVVGYTKFYQEGIYRAAIPAVKEVNTSEIYITHIASDADWWTGISLVNTTSATKELTITFNNGQSVPYTFNANEHKSFMMPDIQSAVITNASGVIGLELFGSIGGGNHLDGILLTDKTTSTIYYPHVASDNVWWTGIVAYNPSTLASTITITPYSAQGTPLTPSTLPIAGNGKYIDVVSNLGLPAGAAWFRIDATRPLTGFELFGTHDGTQLAAYAGGGGTGAREGVFAKIEQGGGWTGIAFVNTEATEATVTLTAYKDNGDVVAIQALSVGGYAKVVNMAEAIFLEDISGATYIAYSSDRNVVGFQVNGTSDGMMLDGLPGM